MEIRPGQSRTVPLHPRVAVTLLTSRSVALYGNQTWSLQVEVPLRTSRSVSQNQVPRANWIVSLGGFKLSVAFS